MKSSTLRSAVDPTIVGYSTQLLPATLRQLVNTEWLQSGQVDLVLALRRHPVLLRNRSLLLELAVEEFRAQRSVAEDIDLEQHCRRFNEFGSSVQRSIQRQLVVQRYIDDCPELLEAHYSPKWPRAGEDFGSFHVLEELGVGASAHVYLCSQHDVGNRTVVVKATPFSSFEASILGRLSHPNIIPIYSTGVIDDSNLNYLCMPYCGRSTLSDLLDVAFQEGHPCFDRPILAAAQRWNIGERCAPARRRRLMFGALGFRTYVDGVLALAFQIAGALEHAHGHRILHGDLKPSNVLLTPSGRPMLLDFNLSREFVSSTTLGGGTLPYMPPEHLKIVAGNEGPTEITRFDPTSDVYSFGALLYELLAGVTPVSLPPQIGDSLVTAEVLFSRLKNGIPSISKSNPLVSRRLESLVLQCLAFDQGNRPSTIVEVKQRLQAEMRSVAALARTARVRPILFSAIVGLPLVVCVGLAAHIVSQPPPHVANYEKGLRLASIGKFDIAIDHLTAALRANPSFAPARFQLGRTRIATGELDLAIDDFSNLARENNHAHSMAYIGYCFNLKSLPVAAILWYERAIRNGAESVAIYNNLGASYIDAQTHLTREEQLRLAESYLLMALRRDATSLTAQRNCARLVITRSSIDASYNPLQFWRRALPTLKWEESSQKALDDLYSTLGPIEKDITATAADFSSKSTDTSLLPTVKRYILEPLVVDDTLQ